MTFRPNPKPAAKAKSPRAMKSKPKVAPVAANPAQAKAEKKLDAERAAKKIGAKVKAIGEKHGQTKGAMIQAMLRTPGGATSKEMEEAAGWQPHSVRGYLGTLRKSGVKVISKKLPGEPTIYRIEAKGPGAETEVL